MAAISLVDCQMGSDGESRETTRWPGCRDRAVHSEGMGDAAVKLPCRLGSLLSTLNLRSVLPPRSRLQVTCAADAVYERR
jgi:hypothetical protein